MQIIKTTSFLGINAVRVQWSKRNEVEGSVGCQSHSTVRYPITGKSLLGSPFEAKKIVAEVFFR